jgi:hypothetical protein
MATRVSSYKSSSISATTSGPIDGGGYTGIFVIVDIGDGGRASYTWKGESATEKAALNGLVSLAKLMDPASGINGPQHKKCGPKPH